MGRGRGEPIHNIKQTNTCGGEIMKKLIKAFSEIQNAAANAGKEIGNLKDFNPKIAQKKLVNMMGFVEDFARQLENFFQTMREKGTAELSLSFSDPISPWTIFGTKYKQEIKINPKKPAKQKEITKKRNLAAH
jgi:hypothetical protein